MKKELKALREKFGTNVDWVELQVHLTHSEMVATFGKRCEEFDPYCAVCRAWLEWNQGNKATVVIERKDVVKLLLDK